MSAHRHPTTDLNPDRTPVGTTITLDRPRPSEARLVDLDGRDNLSAPPLDNPGDESTAAPTSEGDRP